MPLAGYKANIYITTTPSVAFTNEAFTDFGDHKTYTITNAVKRYWDKTVALTVQTSPDNITWTTVTTGFTVNYCGGQIVFTVAVTGTTPSVRVTGAYLPYSLIGGANSVDLNMMMEVLDSSTLGTTWKTKLANMAGGEIKLKRWWIDNFYLSSITSATRAAISITTGANANQRFDAFTWLKEDSIKVAVNALIDENLVFEIDGPVVATAS